MRIKRLLFFCICVSILLTLFILFPPLKTRSSSSSSYSSPPLRQYPARFAYLISLSKGDVNQAKRLVYAIYHPGNHYLLHLDAEASDGEHEDLTQFIAVESVFREVGNVWIVKKSNIVTYRGPTMLANTLHAMAMLLKACDWDWFVNLSAADYPIITQDDLIYAFAALPKDLNFVHHTSHLGWKRNKRAKPIVIDPGLYSDNKSDVMWLPMQRSLPTSFKLFTGSAWTVLSRSFAEYCVWGWENLPRTLLLYFTNFISTPEGYFQTVICNSKLFKNTTVNHDLRYITWDNPPKQHPLPLGLKDYRRMIISSSPFARKFKEGDLVLDRIDKEILKRNPNNAFTYGGWCGGRIGRVCRGGNLRNSYGMLKPGPGGRRLRALLRKITLPSSLRKQQCR
ncbi:core-2/I-branching beta-1,6-N-acetylglucosaminyltransferase family protein [Wolffia australiana]